MTWSNPTASLWYVTSPTPGVILFDGQNYYLTMTAAPAGFKFVASTLADAQSEYIAQATTLLAKTIILSPTLASITAPADGQIVGLVTTSGTIVVGVYSAANQQVTVAAATVPLASIATWSPIPALS